MFLVVGHRIPMAVLQARLRQTKTQIQKSVQGRATHRRIRQSRYCNITVTHFDDCIHVTQVRSSKRQITPKGKDPCFSMAELVVITFNYRTTKSKIESVEACGFVDKLADKDGYYRIRHCSLQEVQGKGKLKNWFWDKNGEYTIVHWDPDHGNDGAKTKGKVFQTHGITRKDLPHGTAHPDEHEDEAVGTLITHNLNLCLFCQRKRNPLQHEAAKQIVQKHNMVKVATKIQMMRVTVPFSYA